MAITSRHRILATILERVSAPLKKADLLAVAQYLIAHVPDNQTPQLAKRHKVEVEKGGSPEQQLMKRISTYDEAALARLRIRAKFGKILLEFSGNIPELEPLERVWQYLSKET